LKYFNVYDFTSINYLLIYPISAT